MITPEITQEILAYLLDKDKMRARSLAFQHLNSLAEAEQLLEILQNPSTHPEFRLYFEQELWVSAVMQVKDFMGWSLMDAKKYVDDLRESVQIPVTDQDGWTAKCVADAYDTDEEAGEQASKSEVQSEIAGLIKQAQANLAEAVLIHKHRLEQKDLAMRQAALAYIAKGEIIEAIKFVRSETGMGLRESKDYVDALRGF